MISHPAIRLTIDAVAVPDTGSSSGFFTLRRWQGECFETLRDSQHWIMNAPMAAGKSFEICALSADALLRDPALRVIIAIPQTIIAPGFRENKIELPDGTRIHWKVTNDLCHESTKDSTAHLRKFLKRTDAGLMSRVILCSHATLVRAFKLEPGLFRDLMIVIDEAHHARHGDGGNQIGALVAHALEHEDVIRIGLTTATFFRGDAASIVPDVSRFNRFDLDYEEYLSTCKYLRSISYDFMIDVNFVTPLTSLFQKRIGKTIVYIPPVTSGDSSGKVSDCNAVFKAIAGTDGEPEIRDRDQPVMRVRRGRQWVKVLNLADVALREEKKNAIAVAHESATDDDIDVIIALGMFKEGANWKWADREIIIGQRKSLTDVVQMLGRMFRDADSKSHVEAFQILPFRFDQADKVALRETLNDYMKGILLSLLLENVIDPAISREANEEPGQPNEEPRKRINYIKEAISDETQAASIISEITECVVDSIGANDAFTDIEQFREPFNDIVDVILDAHGIHEYRQEIARQLLRMFSRRTATFRGLNVAHVDVQLVNENPFDCLLRYGMDTCGMATFADLRRVLNRGSERLPFEQAREQVRQLDLTVEQFRSGQCRIKGIPSNPHTVYREDWRGWADFLGNGRTGRRFVRPFTEARAAVRNLGLKSGLEWREYAASGRRPSDIPSSPEVSYKDSGWVSLRDWIGTDYRDFEDARAFVRLLELESTVQWKEYCKSGRRPIDIPACPSDYYQDSWINWSDWLGRELRSQRRCKDVRYRSFEDARAFVRSLGLKSALQWAQYSKSDRRPADIPAGPAKKYSDRWVNWSDWLGCELRKSPGSAQDKKVA